MRDRIKIQSEGDLITNSSTEVFTIVDENTIKSIRDIVVLLVGEEYADQFDYYLDYCEVIEGRSGEIAEMLLGEGINVPEYIDSESDYKTLETYAYELIKNGVDEGVWRMHYKDSPALKRVENAAKLDYASFLKENLPRLCDDTNQGHDWQYYPSVVIIPKHPESEHDKKVAEKLMHLPYLCNHEATYC